MRRFLAITTSMSAMAVLAFSFPSAPAAAGTSSRPLVVTLNAEQAWPQSRDPSRIPMFVQRLDQLTPRAPDVLLLQEVDRRSARAITGLLSKETGHRYVIAAGAPWQLVHRVRACCRYYELADTGIVVNADTVNVTRRGAIRTWGRHVEKNVWATLNVSGEVLTVASVHLEHTWASRRLKWVRHLMTTIPKAAADVIGGDFNADRSSFAGAFWRGRYKDVLRASGITSAGVDYIFTTGSVYGAGRDRGPKTYSDHRLKWGVL